MRQHQRRQPARLELADRVPGVRRIGGSQRARVREGHERRQRGEPQGRGRGRGGAHRGAARQQARRREDRADPPRDEPDDGDGLRRLPRAGVDARHGRGDGRDQGAASTTRARGREQGVQHRADRRARARQHGRGRGVARRLGGAPQGVARRAHVPRLPDPRRPELPLPHPVPIATKRAAGRGSTRRTSPSAIGSRRSGSTDDRRPSRRRS